jgi:hypothetical protein
LLDNVALRASKTENPQRLRRFARQRPHNVEISRQDFAILAQSNKIVLHYFLQDYFTLPQNVAFVALAIRPALALDRRGQSRSSHGLNRDAADDG